MIWPCDELDSGSQMFVILVLLVNITILKSVVLSVSFRVNGHRLGLMVFMWWNTLGWNKFVKTPQQVKGVLKLGPVGLSSQIYAHGGTMSFENT